MGPIPFRILGRQWCVAAALLGTISTPVLSADVMKGADLYARHCASCHGSNGVPVMPGLPNFARMESLMRPDMQLLQSLRVGRGAMPGYQGVIQDRELLDVIAYLRTLLR